MFLLNCSYTECCDVCNIPERSKTHAAEKSWFWTILKSQFSSADKRRIDSKRSIELAKLAREWSARAFLERVDGSETGVWWLSEKQREKRGRREKKKRKKKKRKTHFGHSFWVAFERIASERERRVTNKSRVRGVRSFENMWYVSQLDWLPVVGERPRPSGWACFLKTLAGKKTPPLSDALHRQWIPPAGAIF